MSKSQPKNKIHILYDFQTFSAQRYGGISRYFYELMSYYDHHSTLDFDLAMKYCDNAWIKKPFIHHHANLKKRAPIQTYDQFLPRLHFKGKMRLYQYISKHGHFNYPKTYQHQYSEKDTDFTPYHYYAYYDLNVNHARQMVSAQKYDLFHPTYYDNYYLSLLGNKPFVLTIYDLIHEIYPEFVPQGDQIVKLKRYLADKASKIIAISETTKRDVIKIMGVPASKIQVVYLASSIKPNRNNYQPKITLPKHYFLFVGTRIGYKNFAFLIKALAPLLREQPDLYLISLGWSPFSHEEINHFKHLDIAGQIRYLPSQSDPDLAFIYQNALALLFPSQYEGFGLPILEAFSCSCPVITTKVSSISEVAGNAALYYQPNQTKSLYQTALAIFNGLNLRQTLIHKGYKQNQRFKWDKTALETQALYQEVISAHSTL